MSWHVATLKIFCKVLIYQTYNFTGKKQNYLITTIILYHIHNIYFSARLIETPDGFFQGVKSGTF